MRKDITFFDPLWNPGESRIRELFNRLLIDRRTVCGRPCNPFGLLAVERACHSVPGDPGGNAGLRASERGFNG